MKVCIKCNKEFNPNKIGLSSFEKDGLCGKCRSKAKWIEQSNSKRKTKICPDCGKSIDKDANRCGKCSQMGSRNHRYTNGNTASTRKCLLCGAHITSGSKKGMCQKCYISSISGENNPNYKFGNYTGLLESTDEYKNWRTSVYTRDGYMCKLCGSSKSNSLQAHHIYPKRYFQKLLFDIDNGITLCKDCHSKTFNKEYAFVELFTSIIHAKLKPRELGELCNENTEPSIIGNYIEGVETRCAPNPLMVGQ